MAFEGFDHFTERRKAEKEQMRRKNIAIAGVTILVLLALAAVCAVAVLYQTRSAPPKKELSHVRTNVRALCEFTDYKDTCEKRLSKASDADHTKPKKELIQIAISVVAEEIDAAIKVISSFKFDKPGQKEAYDDCKVLFQDAKEELGVSVSLAADIASNNFELRNSLSAVMSYQQTCLDGFPADGVMLEMLNATKTAKELTSNALAIVPGLWDTLSRWQETRTRRLLAEESDGVHSREGGGFPGWMTPVDRRMLEAEGTHLKPNAVVAKDGSGNFTTISDALTAMPSNFPGRYVIYIKEGIYDETVTITKKMVNVTMYGDGSQKTIITGNKNNVDGVRTFHTPSFVAVGDRFMAQSMGFRNTAGPEKEFATAIRVQSDRSIFLNCRIEGNVGTLNAQTHRQFYRGCVIAGASFFILGDAAAVFQNCIIMVRMPWNNQASIITAHARVDKHETTGFVLQNCRIVGDKQLEEPRALVRTVYLGRPLKEFSRTIVMESQLGDLVHPKGWFAGEKELVQSQKTLFLAEYKNEGTGAEVKDRVRWAGYKVINRKEAEKYTVGPFLQGLSWLKKSEVPVHFGLYH